MWQRMKATWAELKHAPAGERFLRCYELHQRQHSKAVAVVYPIAALVSFAIGVVLVFIPGPAFVFFGLALGLMATHSRWLARRLDAAEVELRSWWDALKRRRKHSRPT